VPEFDDSTSPKPGGGVRVVKLTARRRTIARRLTEAWTAPAFQLTASVDMTQATARRAEIEASLPAGEIAPTLNDLLIQHVAGALLETGALNATFHSDEIHVNDRVHMGIAVATPKGLVVPVLRDVDQLTLAEISRRRAELVNRARERQLTAEDLEGGTFTISNLGMFGIDQFNAVLNPPQVAILAAGAVRETPVIVDGNCAALPTMQLTLTCDHRATDGAEAAIFLRTLRQRIEHPPPPSLEYEPDLAGP
jgi:pyruvate dehydrogenase E2 component (dihydrolipoamide acetyltransferase)